MNGDFKVCFPITLREESGEVQQWGKPIKRNKYSYLDDPNDPGGATMLGVTHRQYDAFRRVHGLPERDVRMIEDAEVVGIYREMYWNKIPGEHLPLAVAIVVFDMTLHSGPMQAIKELQRVVGVDADGHLGPVTIDAVEAADEADVVVKYVQRRRGFLRQLKNYRYFKKNWEERCGRIEDVALSYARGEAAAASIRPAANPIPVEPAGLPDDEPEETWQTEVIPTGRATHKPSTSMATSGTANGALLTGSGGTAQIGTDAAGVLAKLNAAGHAWGMGDFLLALAQRPSFWISLGIVVGSAWVWLRKQRDMRLA